MDTFEKQETKEMNQGTAGREVSADTSDIRMQQKEAAIAAGRKDTVFAVIFLALSAMWIDFSLFGGFNLGFTVSMVLFIIATISYMAGKSLRLNVFTVGGSLLMLAFAIVPSLYSDTVSKTVVIAAIFFLAAMLLCEICRGNRFSNRTFRGLANAFDFWLRVPVEKASAMLRAVFFIQEEGKRRRAAGTALGIVCAVPVAAVAVSLLIRSDAAFEGLIRMTVFGNMGRVVVSLLLGILLFLMVFTSEFALRKNCFRETETVVPAGSRRVEPAGVNAFLGVLGFFYLLYLFSQLAYFFSAFSGVLPQNYTTAEYARRGFFEMAAICTINLAVVCVSILLTGSGDKRIVPPTTRLFDLFIILFSALLIGTALSKMFLYIRSFGLTRLRVGTSVFMVMLFILLATLAVRLFLPRFPYMKASLLLGGAVLAAVLYADVDAVTARYNVWAYRSGLHTEIDVETLGYLSDAAVPEMVKLLDDYDPQVAQRAAVVLGGRYQLIQQTGAGYSPDGKCRDFRVYNVSTQLARELLYRYKDRLCLEPEPSSADGEETPIGEDGHLW